VRLGKDKENEGGVGVLQIIRKLIAEKNSKDVKQTKIMA